MIASAQSFSLLVAIGFGTSALACSPSDDGGAGTDNTGGATAGGTGGSGDGSGGTGTGGGDSSGGGSMSTGGTGNDGTGGGSGSGLAFECPAGLVGQQPTLPANAGTPIDAPAVMGENRFLEGPVWDGTHLYVSQLRDYGGPAPARILRLEGNAFVEFIPDERAGTNGLAIRGDGKLVGASSLVGDELDERVPFEA